MTAFDQREENPPTHLAQHRKNIDTPTRPDARGALPQAQLRASDQSADP
jgi:hypothetical protein